MAMKQCPNNHVYDDQRNAVCPYCSGSGDIGVTRPLGDTAGYSGTPPVMQAPAFPKTAPVNGGMGVGSAVIPKTMPVNNPEINKTVALHINEKGIDPVRGWLVCIDGEKKGKDFRIHSEKNFIGRAKSNDICLDFDDSISKEVNVIIAYDNRNNQFFIHSGEGKNNIYVNETLLLAPRQLQDYDIVEIGKTKMMFRSFCGADFSWDAM